MPKKSGRKKVKAEDLDEFWPGEEKKAMQENPGYLGFAFTKEGKRVKHYYNSEAERAHCECGELCDQGLFVEAMDKWNEHVDTSSLRYPDANLRAQMLVGYNKTLAKSGKLKSKKAKKENFEATMDAHSMQAWHDGGSHQDEIVEQMVETVKAHLKQFIPTQKDEEDDDWDPESSYYFPDYENSNVSVEELMDAADAWFTFIAAFNDGFVGLLLSESTEAVHDSIHGIVLALGKRREFRTATAIVERMLKADSTMKQYCTPYECIFQSLRAECAEAVGDSAVARKAYASIPTTEQDDCYGESMIGNDLCPPGTLAERLARTAQQN